MSAMSPIASRPRIALAAVATTLVVLAGCGDATEPAASDPDTGSLAGSTPSSEATSEVTSKPTGAASVGRQRIPDGFPLAADLPETNGDDGSPVRVTESHTFTDFRPCGELVWSPDTPEPTVDVAGTTYTGEAEDSRSRTLALYADTTAATTALAHVRDAITACPSDQFGVTEQVYEEVAGDADTATFTHRFRTDGRFDTGLEVLQLVRVGNALYLASYYGEGGGSPESIASSLDFVSESSARVVAAMSAFEA